MLLGPSILPFFPLRKKTHFLGTSQEGVEPQFFANGNWRIEGKTGEWENWRISSSLDQFVPIQFRTLSPPFSWQNKRLDNGRVG